MLVGMGFVYGFLSLVILVIKVVIAPLAKRFPDEIPTAQRTRDTQVSTKASSTTDDTVVAVIAAAVSRYRNKLE